MNYYALFEIVDLNSMGVIALAFVTIYSSSFWYCCASLWDLEARPCYF